MLRHWLVNGCLHMDLPVRMLILFDIMSVNCPCALERPLPSVHASCAHLTVRCSQSGQCAQHMLATDRTYTLTEPSAAAALLPAAAATRTRLRVKSNHHDDVARRDECDGASRGTSLIKSSRTCTQYSDSGGGAFHRDGLSMAIRPDLGKIERAARVVTARAREREIERTRERILGTMLHNGGGEIARAGRSVFSFCTFKLPLSAACAL
jgi:hypothetical protein